MATISPWLLGTWQREWIRRGGVTSNTRIVRYLQTPTRFGDLRIPRDRPRFDGARALADLADSDLAVLAQQSGFFGVATVEGDVCTWHHELDYQPPGAADMGRLERSGGSSLLEHGLDGSFVERWWPLSSGDGKFLAVQTTQGARIDRILLVAGDHFVYARNRAKDLPAAASLEALVASAERAQVLAYLDCELSHGLVRGGASPWLIDLSTLPWREGSRLEFADEISVGPDGAPVGSAPPATWTVPVNTMTPEDLRVIFASGAP